jgi:acetyltransferase-like isoleucine patch superfamily enzyme
MSSSPKTPTMVPPDNALERSRDAFADDALLRTFDCADALYDFGADGAIHGGPEGRQQLFALHDHLRDRWLRHLQIEGAGATLPADHAWFHPRFGWVASSPLGTVYLGKTRVFEAKPIVVGRRSYLSGPSSLRGSDPLVIGSFCSIAEELFLNTTPDLHSLETPATFAFDGEARDETGDWYFPQPFVEFAEARSGITIGHDVWIARRVRIFHGAEVGSGCVVAEGSLVRGKLEPYGIYAGTPAKLKRLRFPAPVVEQLLELRWWDWERERILRNHAFFNTRLANFDGRLADLIVP